VVSRPQASRPRSPVRVVSRAAKVDRAARTRAARISKLLS
jgi:hypothetical protein